MDNWKGIRLHVHQQKDGPIELYNLSEDPQEQNNVASQHPEIIQQIDELMAQSHVPSPLFPFQSE